MKLFTRFSLVFSIAAWVAGCGFIPASGPSIVAVHQGSSITVEDNGRLGYAILKISPLVVARTKALVGNAGFSSATLRSRQTDIRIGVGDLVSVAIFEAGTGGLFNPADSSGRSSGRSVTLPVQQVDNNGFISIPYAGSIKAAGQTTEEVRAEIISKLQNRAIEPQIAVNIQDRRSGTISILGDVTTPQHFGLDPGGSRLLEAIARAGGAKYPAFETIVTLQRRGQLEQVPLTSVVRDPRQNVFLRQGDTIVLSREPRSFLVLGATPAPGSIGGQNNRRFLFETENLTLAEAIAKAGGLNTSQADARAVFIYRQESRAVLTGMGVDVSEHPGERIPTIYQLDLLQADGYFLATQFYIRDRDLVYISDAPGFELAKFIAILGSGASLASDAIRASNF